MKDIVSELQFERDALAADTAYEDRLPTEANALRQFTFCAITDFLEGAASDWERLGALIHAMTDRVDDLAVDNLVVEWIAATYGKDDKR